MGPAFAHGSRTGELATGGRGEAGARSRLWVGGLGGAGLGKVAMCGIQAGHAAPAPPASPLPGPAHLLRADTLPPGASEASGATQAGPLEFCSNGTLSPSLHVFSLFNTTFSFPISQASPLRAFPVSPHCVRRGMYFTDSCVLSVSVLDGERHEDRRVSVLFCLVAFFFIA